jgi:CRP-like cAMP-binding protein
MNNPVQQKLEEFFGKYHHLFCKKNQVIINSSQTPDSIYYLKQGRVKQYFINADGEEISLHIFTPGSYFPMMLLLSESENKYHFAAIEDVELYKAPFDDVLEFLKKEPEILFDLTKRFSEGLSKLLLKTENTLFQDSLKRVVSTLLYLADKFGEKDTQSVIITIPITHSDLGTWTGLTRETVSRQMAILSNKNLIKSINNKITILDPQSLKQEL